MSEEQDTRRPSRAEIADEVDRLAQEAVAELTRAPVGRALTQTSRVPFSMYTEGRPALAALLPRICALAYVYGIAEYHVDEANRVGAWGVMSIRAAH